MGSDVSSLNALQQLASGYHVADRSIKVNSAKSRTLNGFNDGVEN